jgi:hypothetical protein
MALKKSFEGKCLCRKNERLNGEAKATTRKKVVIGA